MTKHRYIYLFALSLLALSFWGCNKDDDGTSENEPVADRFSCEINGVPFQASGSFSCDALLFSFTPETEPEAGNGYMVVRGKNCASRVSVGIRMYNLEPYIGSIDLTQPNVADSASPFIITWEGSEPTVYEQLISGTVDISEMYPRSNENPDKFGRFTGTFNFKVRSVENGDVLNITNGFFHFQVGSYW